MTRIDDVVHQLEVAVVLAARANHQLRLERQPARACTGLAERAHHRIDERVHLALVVAVEAIAEAGERDRVERQPRHAVGDVVIGVRAEALPLRDELIGDVDHVGPVAAHRERAERGHEHAVRDRPCRRVVVGREQGVAAEVAQLAQRRVHDLLEPRLVADLVDQRVLAEHEHGLRRELQPVHRAELLRELHHRLNRGLDVDARRVADERIGARLGDGAVSDFGAIRVPS